MNLDTRWRWVINFNPRSLYPMEITMCPLNWRLGGPHGRSGHFWRRVKGTSGPIFVLPPYAFMAYCSTAPLGPRPPNFLSFEITLRHTTLGRTPLDEWSARHRDLYLTTHNTHNRQTSMPPGGIRTRNPSKRAAADPRLRPRATGIIFMALTQGKCYPFHVSRFYH
jgi:hypothetical protein